MRNVIASILLVLAASCDPAYAGGKTASPEAQPQVRRCYSRGAVATFLTAERGQRRAFRARINDRVLIEVWMRPDNGEWTLVTTTASGISCLTGTGTGFSFEPPASKPEERDG